MSYITVEVDIDHGRIVPREPERIPAMAKGILTILPAESHFQTAKKRERVRLPLIEGDGKHTVNPTREELDASLWGD